MNRKGAAEAILPHAASRSNTFSLVAIITLRPLARQK
jgi:hypothetical protein